MAAWKRVHRQVLSRTRTDHGVDWLAVEELLEIRIHGQPVAVLLCTPGREGDLVAGFLAAERVIAASGDLAGVEACRGGAEEEGRVWNAVLAPGVPFDPRARRFGVVNASCGLCGAARVEDLREQAVPAPPASRPSLAWLEEAFAAMARAQDVHARTAGVHAAALLPLAGGSADVAEDVGRHNAVDKVLGARLRVGGYPLEEACALLVSGRISFEIVQKAVLGGVAVLAGAGAPTSLAVEAATTLGLALYGLVRGGRANCYTGQAEG